MKKTVIGILAHVDAGKTTLSEAMLFCSGTTQSLGRVDKRSSFLDTYSLERERGITIFSKLAVMKTESTEITLVDTPGHIDFSCEAERSLSVVDYAILVINACDGIQSHTKTLWHLLKSRRIPTFIFINKTDISDSPRRELMRELKAALSPALADFSTEEVTLEDAAGCDEELMREYFETGTLSDSSIAEAISKKRLFPCYFGSALKTVGIKEFLSGLDRFTLEPKYPEKLFGAKVYKISRDKAGKRLTYMKITGGKLACKDILRIKTQDGQTFSEKVEEIRIYSGDKFRSVKEALPGTVCAVLGAEHTAGGMGLGIERSDEYTLSPVLDYKMILPEGVSVYEAYLKLSALTEEDPTLSLSYRERAKEIRVRLMGEIQLEVLRRLIKERFDLDVSFGEGSILYKETIHGSALGAGHFEPLRHYAEVHLKIEAAPVGTGIVTDTDCSTDVLATNWQRLIITHIEERAHRGVLTGSPLTDVKITLMQGKAHIKHTEGGDFRQATYRAIRQGLMKAESVLLEPTFDFRIELPPQNLGRAMTDIEKMGGTADAPEVYPELAVITGNCPVATMRSYATELRAYTRGEGRLTVNVSDYRPCHNADEVIAAIGYDPMLDERHTPNSVFCKEGAGYVVPWYEADALMHLSPEEGGEDHAQKVRAHRPGKVSYRGTADEDKELMRIFEATYGKIKPRHVAEKTEIKATEEKPQKPKKPKPPTEKYLIVDGYNLIFAESTLQKYAESDVSLARDMLIRLMCDYSAFKKCRVIVVFDAYNRRGGEGSRELITEPDGNVTVIYTKERQTADSFIEKTTHDIAKSHEVRVVTSDREEQQIVLGSGGLRVSSREFALELREFEDQIKEIIESIR